MCLRVCGGGGVEVCVKCVVDRGGAERRGYIGRHSRRIFWGAGSGGVGYVRESAWATTEEPHGVPKEV